jgi:uncharacterized membrane protein
MTLCVVRGVSAWPRVHHLRPLLWKAIVICVSKWKCSRIVEILLLIQFCILVTLLACETSSLLEYYLYLIVICICWTVIQILVALFWRRFARIQL